MVRQPRAALVSKRCQVSLHGWLAASEAPNAQLMFLNVGVGLLAQHADNGNSQSRDAKARNESIFSEKHVDSIKGRNQEILQTGPCTLNTMCVTKAYTIEENAKNQKEAKPNPAYQKLANVGVACSCLLCVCMYFSADIS